MKTMSVKSPYSDEIYEVNTIVGNYAAFGNLAIELFDVKEGPYACLTVNVAPLGDPTLAAVDTNNFTNAVDVIKEYGLGVDTGLRVQSGFCSYPVFKFDLNKVNEYALEEGES